MSTFEILKEGETIFSNPSALDIDYVPKLLPHRENQQKYVATCIKPLLIGMNGKNLIVKGTSGIGKTASIRRILMDLEEETDAVKPIYINCWTKNTSYKIATEICAQLGYKFTFNMSTDDINKKLEELFSKLGAIVFVFDEIDKMAEYDFLYFLLEASIKKTIVLITSDLGWSASLDSRILSRLMPDSVTFEPYTPSEVADILKERIKYAFYQGVWSEDAFVKIAGHSSRFNDIRVGIALLKSAGLSAEEDSSRRVLLKHAESAICRIDEIKVKTSSDLTEDEKQLLELVKENNNCMLTELFDLYQRRGGDKTDRTFRRKLAALARRGLLELESVTDKQGQGTRVLYKGVTKTLSDF